MTGEFTEQARSIIAGNRYLSLATCGPEGPWVAPIAYVVDGSYRFYWYSAVEARHSRHISESGKAAVAIFDSTLPSDTADGLQMDGTAGEVQSAELAEVMRLYWTQSFPDPDVRARWMRPAPDFQGEAPQRFYWFAPNRVFKPDPTSLKVDRRVEISLDRLRERAAHPIESAARTP